MNASQVLTAFRNQLVADGLVRRASVPGDQSAPNPPTKPDKSPPPVHLEPIAAPAPGEREAPENDDTLVVTLRNSAGFGESNFDSYRRRVIVDVIYRSKGTGALKRAYQLDADIAAAVSTGRPDYGLGWQMDGVWVLSSQRYTDIGPVSRDPEQGSTEIARYFFEVQAAD